ncbi:methylated-DNA--[protein]-cysteine S-methyltransferase [Pseudodesulfovibrio piezophilus]|uniref:methylated-DNA--[protein]-cysteine S-methyltransferase n=1 Tax=Pseudodesulfovibrio piezophilus (strain DSM 21447 / JCM 15486 / C1TLV30) TaxID=1322246 RepID=M1WK81_PSEP2
MLIHSVLTESFLGLVMMAATEHGLCAVEFGESESALNLSLAARFPKAEIRAGDASMIEQAGALADFIKQPIGEFPLPLDIQGTAFQQRVWLELRTIPAGETRTYSDVAEALDCPKSARAVAGACARNRLAVVIPCHRVVGKNGALTGYYWGIERKKALLKNERTLTP